MMRLGGAHRDVPRPPGMGMENTMNRIRTFRAALVALVPLAAIALAGGPAAGQSPAPSPSPTVTPSPAPPAPAPPPAETKSPADPPAPSTSQTPVPPPPAAAVQNADPFGEQFTLEPRKVVIMKGTANWDAAFDTLMDSIKALSSLLDKQGIKPAGNSMVVYTSTDDTGFTFLAEIPVEQDPKNLTKDMSIGKSPEGKALKFVHRGSYDNMDNTYEAITNHLDDKKLEAKDTFIEEYITDPLKTAEDKLVINVYVPLK
jgi:effector-binding domain-containing protein